MCYQHNKTATKQNKKKSERNCLSLHVHYIRSYTTTKTKQNKKKEGRSSNTRHILAQMPSNYTKLNNIHCNCVDDISTIVYNKSQIK